VVSLGRLEQRLDEDTAQLVRAGAREQDVGDHPEAVASYSLAPREAARPWRAVGGGASGYSAPYRRCGSIEIEAGRSLPTKIGRRMCD